MRVLITGGLGLVGSNYARHCLSRGDQVVILDNYSRGKSCVVNGEWLFEGLDIASGGALDIINGNVARAEHVQQALEVYKGIDRVVHAAAQSSVNLSMLYPEVDFASNTLGTFTLLEVLRKEAPKARMIYMASNKVYDVTGWSVERDGTRYRWVGRTSGPSEEFPFHTDAREPYGASKISGLYYSRCYAAMYDMPIICVVPSGMYGPQQFGRAAQGWLGWFVIASLLGIPVEINGDGYQVRDMLHTKDVCSAFDMLFEAADLYKGDLFNLGGGPRNAISLHEALHSIRQCLHKVSPIKYDSWRPQDNKVYVSNINRLVGLGWYPTVPIDSGIQMMCEWAVANEEVLRALYFQEEQPVMEGRA